LASASTPRAIEVLIRAVMPDGTRFACTEPSWIAGSLRAGA